MRTPLVLLVISLSLSSCASRQERLALQHCRFTPLQLERLPAGPDSLRFLVQLEVDNPGPTPAVLDSLRLWLETPAPLARLEHGKTRRIGPGKRDTVEVRISLAQADLLAQGMRMAFAPPDSVRVHGQAWIPRPFGWGWSRHALDQRWPLDRVKPALRALLRNPSGQ